MTTVSINGVNIFYKEAGSGEPLVLVHGSGFNADVWDPVIPSLAKDFRVIAYDRRAYYRSTGNPPAKNAYTEQHGEDLAMLLQALNATPATLVAWSAGAFYAFYNALNYPDRIKQMVLYEPPLYAARSYSLSLLKMIIQMNWFKAVGKPQSAADVFMQVVLSYADGRNSYDHLPADFRATMVKDTQTFLAEFAVGTGEEFKARTLRNDVKTSIKFILGERSDAMFQRSMKQLTNIFPQAPLVKIPNGNHLAHMDQPEAFIKAIQEAVRH